MRDTKMQTSRQNTVELEGLGLDFLQVDRLQQIARSLRRHREKEIACNYELTPRQEKRAENLELEASRIVESSGLHIYIVRVPRGSPLYVWNTVQLDRYRDLWDQPDLGIGSCYDTVATAVCPY